MQLSGTASRKRFGRKRRGPRPEAVVDYDPLTRVKKILHYSKHDDSYVVEYKQDASPTLDLNKASMNQTKRHTRWKEGLNRVASIPLVVWEQLMESGIAYDNKALKRWLDDPDNQVFRTRPGRLS